MVEELIGLNGAGLYKRLQTGFAIDPTALDDSRYLGTSLGLPAFVDRLTWKTFEKTFHRDAEALRGWNVRLQQDTNEAMQVQGSGDRQVPKTFGHYRVHNEGHRLMLDYGLLRDPLVALIEGDVQWLFGRTLLGPIPTPSYFVLQRRGPLTHVPD